MKKFFLLVMAVSLAALVFAGGASGQRSSSGDVTLTFAGWEVSPLETAAVKNGIAAFEKANPGIKVQYTPFPNVATGEYVARMLSAMSSGNSPDVMFVATGDYRTWAGRNVLLDITDRFGSTFPLDDFIASSRTIMNVNGKIYGISSCSVSPIIYYNKAIFDKYGEPYPSSDPNKIWTIDEFRAVAKRLTRDGIYGCYGLETNGIMVFSQALSAGATPISADGTKSTYNTPAVKRVLETIKSIRVDDRSMPSASTLENVGMNASQMLSTGKVAMLMDGSWAMQELSTLGFPVGIAPIPSYGNPITTGQAHVHAISKTSKHPEEAWKFLQFLSSVEYQGQLCREGLWLPNRYSLWADGAKGIDGWYDNARLGPYYRQMRNYLRDAAVSPDAMFSLAIINDITSEEQDKFFKDNQPIDTTLANIERRVNAELAASR
jgi:multiple sugar transport system substrate-binding protein